MIPLNTSRIEISRSAYKHNLFVIRKLIGDKVTFTSVVKGNAYGHGINEFVPMAYDMGVRSFAVFDAHEAYLVKKCLGRKNISLLIMGMITDEELGWAIENNVDFYVFNFGRLNKAIEASKKLKKSASIHIEVETGMNRTGFKMRDIKKVIRTLKDNREHLRFIGLCMHFAGAESLANYLRVQAQYENYKWFLAEFEKAGLSPKLRHTACSAAVLSYPDTILDMARIGILQYGFWPSKEVSVLNFVGKGKHYELKRVITWKSTVMAVKDVKAGEYVGYGNSYLAEKDIKIAVIPVGYAHGFSRVLSNVGKVLIHGKRLSVVGLVNMNCMIVEVTNVKKVLPGDEVILIGKQGNIDLTVGSFSDLTNQLNYELLSRLPRDIPRTIVD